MLATAEGVTLLLGLDLQIFQDVETESVLKTWLHVYVCLWGTAAMAVVAREESGRVGAIWRGFERES